MQKKFYLKNRSKEINKNIVIYGNFETNEFEVEQTHINADVAYEYVHTK